MCDCWFHDDGYCRTELCPPHDDERDVDWTLEHPDEAVDALRLRHPRAGHLLDHLVGAARRELEGISFDDEQVRVVREELEGAWHNLKVVLREDSFKDKADSDRTWVYLIEDDSLASLWGSPRVALYSRNCTDQEANCRPHCDRKRPAHPVIRTVYQQKELLGATITDDRLRWSGFDTDVGLHAFLASRGFDGRILKRYQSVGEIDIDESDLEPFYPHGMRSPHLTVSARLIPRTDEDPVILVSVNIPYVGNSDPEAVRKFLRENRQVAVYMSENGYLLGRLPGGR